MKLNSSMNLLLRKENTSAKVLAITGSAGEIFKNLIKIYYKILVIRFVHLNLSIIILEFIKFITLKHQP